MPPTPEEQSRKEIDAALRAAGWIIQDRAEMNVSAGLGVAVREFKMAPGHGYADYLLFVGGKAVGALEAKPAGYPLISVELQADKYATGLPALLDPPVNPLPFIYLSNGVERLARVAGGVVLEFRRPTRVLGSEWLLEKTPSEWRRTDSAY